MKSAFWILIMLLAITAGCGGGGADVAATREARIARQEAVINIGADPRTLDPSLASDVASSRAILGLIRGLTVLDDAGEPQPELAESWTVSDDGRVYEIQLREARWSNGEPVTAEDFRYTWLERMLNPEFGSEYSYQLFYIAGAEEFFQDPSLGPERVGVEVLAPDRLRVTLKNPAGFFPQLLAHHSFFAVPASVARENPDWSLNVATYVENGPFLLEEYLPGDRIMMVKNPDYWNAANVKLERLALRMIQVETSARIAFDTGEIDATESVPRADLEQMLDRPELKYSSQYATYFLNFNTQQAPLDDPRVRRALALAMDRRAITTSITRAGEEPAFHLTPRTLYEIPPEKQFDDADYDEARRLLAEAGYPGGKGISQLRYIYNTMEGHRLIAQVLQETWRRELGVDISIENQEFKVLIENRQAGNFDIARAGWTADFADAMNFLEIFDPDSENNDSHWRDEHYGELLADARAEANPERREALLREAEEYMIEQMPIAPIYYYTSPYLVHPRLQHFTLGPTGMFDPARLAWSEE